MYSDSLNNIAVVVVMCMEMLYLC